MQLLIIADDLTGALDSAVTLARVGLRCVVARRPSDLPGAAEGAEVVAVSTASRVEASAATCGRQYEGPTSSAAAAATCEAIVGQIRIVSWLFIIADSSPEQEYLETLDKARGIIDALAVPL